MIISLGFWEEEEFKKFMKKLIKDSIISIGMGKKKEKITSVTRIEELVPFGYKIKVKTTTYFDYLYKEVFFWMQHYGYDWKELNYGIIEFPNGSARLEFLWKGVKGVDDYSTFIIDCQLAATVSDLKVKTERGKETKMKSGTHEFRIGAYIKKNVDIWEGKPFGNQQAKLYEMLIRDRLEEQKNDLYVEAHKFIDHLKALLEFYPQEK
ncbi:hypothetical protein CL616_00665 [archaeon]|nr:hypothetical protein [archaeon]|tara:strand:- start:189 stop:812 length:624 start_codon:yes stop_codon:yes gene_type:complete